MITATRRWPMIGIASLMAVFVVTAIPAAAEASTPVGKVALTPGSVLAGSTGNVFRFTIRAVKGLSGSTSIQIPALWTAPRVAPTAPGYVAAAKGTCRHVATPRVTGTGPWTIKLRMTCARGKRFTVTYGANSGTTHVRAPTVASAYSFPVSVRVGKHTHQLSAPQVIVQPGPAVRLDVTGLPAPSETGAPLSVTVTAVDAFGNVATSYAGTVHFTSSDAGASLPPSFTFVTADLGTQAFSGGVMFAHEGTQSVTATDTTNSAITGTDSVSVNGVLFVATSGSDANPGTQAQPLRTVTAAVTTAAASSPPFAVDVAGGQYSEASGVAVTSGITIDGGFSPTKWTQSAAEVTTISGTSMPVTAVDAAGVVLENLSLQGNTLALPGESSYALFAEDSSLILDHVTVSVANGSAGSAGVGGLVGSSGSGGTAGGNGLPTGGCTDSFGAGGYGGTVGAPGGSGGDGGCSGGNGTAGTAGTTAAGGGLGGASGSAGTGDQPTKVNGGNGDNGTNGSPGSNGLGGTDTIIPQSGPWTGGNGSNGSPGQYGGGGGGGGGGGALSTGCFITCAYYNGGAGGGGAGSGGGPGGAAGGGQYGGGSFGIYLVNSTITLHDSVVRAGNGGPGGAGGNGGRGGTGGSGARGGTGSNGSGTGGDGGAGGNGGGGGGGGGGAGGPSAGIFLAGTSTAQTNASDVITAGTGGAGGVGGSGPSGAAPSGETGPSAAILP